MLTRKLIVQCLIQEIANQYKLTFVIHDVPPTGIGITQVWICPPWLQHQRTKVGQHPSNGDDNK